ncbi:aminopeptidase P family protein [Nisaea nitritireducens]|uniref:aminopeptidase P family protein n=1 Tax=Nisaea nitritireducens TaxID=568392 RepID=UPI0018682875|nr:aminopeptidase P family protein [Nisaea nitritireducens]
MSATGTAAERLDAFRGALAEAGVDGMIVPRADAHQSEYLPTSAERVAWLTGFNGSAGTAVVLRDKAAVFTDGRYSLQIENQVDGALYQRFNIADKTAADWIGEELGNGQRFGIDPWLHTDQQVERLRKAVDKAGGELVLLDANPLDAVWADRPQEPAEPMLSHPVAYAGKRSEEKRTEIAGTLTEAGADALLITSAESIAWLLNVRGNDVGNTPLCLCFAILSADGTLELFIDGKKLGPDILEHLGNAVTVRPQGELGDALDRISGDGLTVRIDPASAPVWAMERVRKAEGKLDLQEDPIVAAKAAKNDIEMIGVRAAHYRDALAYARFLCWFSSRAHQGGLDEMTLVERLHGFRAEHEMFRGPSFDTISGAGPNGAIVHYRVTEESNRNLEPGEIYLVDSGAQYLDGTTDITRTLSTGIIGEEEQRCFTLVLKGMIALSRAIFPQGTTGGQLDALARRPLWEAGLDYDHGTGHGVGAYLGVHEGPQRISKSGGGAELKPGMIISNEPGYYRAGAFGIRIENLVAVEPRDVPGAERPMLGFETLTLAPIDRALIDLSLLDSGEVAWLDAYHARVRETLSPDLDPETAVWLAEATVPLAPQGA